MKRNTVGYGIFIILGIFAFRVIAQLIQFLCPISFLPSFESWHSGTLNYGVLLLSQIVIIIYIARQGTYFLKGKVQPNPTKGKLFFGLGILYFSSMLIRLIGGLTFASHHYWFSAKIPTFFHLVLASFFILVGCYHLRSTLHALTGGPQTHNSNS